MKVKTTAESVPSAFSPKLRTEVPGAAANNLRSRVFFWTKIILTITVLILLIVTIHPREISSAFSGARYPLVMVSLILVIPNLGLRAMKWGYILRQVKPEATMSEIVKNLLIGFTFAVVTPGQLGEFGRAFFITGRPRLELIGLSFVDKIYNLIPIILGGSLGLLFLPGLVFGGNLYVFISSCILVGLLWLILSLILLSPRWIRDLFYAVNVMLPYRDKIKVLLSGLDPIFIRQSVFMTSLGVAHYMVAIIQYYLLVLSFQAVGFLDAFRASSATLFTKAALPISIGGLGVGETASVGFFRIFEIGQAAAFNSSVMLFTMNVLFPAVLGFFILLRQRIAQDNNHA
jgi:hypothetical protein